MIALHNVNNPKGRTEHIPFSLWHSHLIIIVQEVFTLRFSNLNASPDSASATISTNNHDHQWSYVAQGNTITATCANTDGGHGMPLTATLTVVAPTLTTYGGTGSADATITGSIEGVMNPTIVYKHGSETLNTAPTNAGTFTASITLGEGDGAAMPRFCSQS